MNLVHKDQLEILATLRESVNEDKAGLEAEVQRLIEQTRELSDKNKMQLEQINALLFEKVSLQSEGLDQRDRMLQRERDIGYVCHVNFDNPGTHTFLGSYVRLSLGKIYQKISRRGCSRCMKRVFYSKNN